MARASRRTCVGCRTVREPQALVRITADEAGNLLVNPRRPAGRGAYVCPSPACLAEAWRRRALPRALRRELPGVNESAVWERFGVELGRRGVVLPAVPPTGPAGGDSAAKRHRHSTRRPSGGWDGRR